MTITEFLLARIAEDEAVAKRVGNAKMYRDDLGRGWIEGPLGHVAITDGRRDIPVAEAALLDHLGHNMPGRVLAECEAKRRIVELSWHHLGEDDYGWGMEEAKRQVLVLLALPYADHPDYREEWRP